MVIGSDKNITTANVTQLHNNIPKILSKINIILIIKSITPKINNSLILNYYFYNNILIKYKRNPWEPLLLLLD